MMQKCPPHLAIEVCLFIEGVLLLDEHTDAISFFPAQVLLMLVVDVS